MDKIGSNDKLCLLLLFCIVNYLNVIKEMFLMLYIYICVRWIIFVMFIGKILYLNKISLLN